MAEFTEAIAEGRYQGANRESFHVGLGNGADHVDARNQWAGAHDATIAGNCHGVFVVQRRIRHIDGKVAFAEKLSLFKGGRNGFIFVASN